MHMVNKGFMQNPGGFHLPNFTRTIYWSEINTNYSKMFGERSFEMVKDVERQMTGSATGVPTYDENGVRQVLDEMQSLFDQNQKALENKDEDKDENKDEDMDENMDGSQSTVTAGTLAGVHLRHAALERNKDCLLAYMSTRLDRIRSLRWIKGSVLPETDQNNMTEQEMQYFTDYNKMLANYMRDIGVDGDYDGLDLTEHMAPPKSHMVYFRVLKEYGEFEPEDGKVIVLKKNCVHHLPRYQCETLLRQGVIEIMPE